MRASRIALLAAGNPRRRLSRLLRLGGTVADYDATKGITGTTNASAWANQIGAAGPLLQASGAAQPSIEADGSLLFDGIAQFMQAEFALSSPATVYLVISPISWTNADYIIDGKVSDTLGLVQRTATPKFSLENNGVYVGDDPNLTLGSWHVLTVVLNSTSSSTKVDQAAAIAGTTLAAAPNGLTLGAVGSGLTGFSNIQVRRVTVRSAADSAATQAQIQSLLKTIYGTP